MIVLPIFYNVDPSDLVKLKGAFAKAFDEHEKQFKEKVGTWRAALNHVAGIVGYQVKNSPLSEVVKIIVRLVSHKSSFEFSEITEGLKIKRSLVNPNNKDIRDITGLAPPAMGARSRRQCRYGTKYEALTLQGDKMFFGVARSAARTSTGALLEAVIEARLAAKDQGFQHSASD
ncbi:hypothetical protein CMV_014145 [Castanea mollissima]|uniref:TIR domain-containing protein n=1 Tax=Castanea mollissima TaxID=60419 RepID=A0A8J4VHF0_9ROSI|nr:hypothetical protein CMV_014145 [Castanea mollissima]